ncbi:MAG: helix-turn-helix transcriptional regulator [Cyanobacteria bacterium P01_D01_bin.73]
MTTAQQPQNWIDSLQPGTPSDTRLFHADSSDRIRICPSHLGQGYYQYIPLQDDVTLVILDYTLEQDVAVDATGPGDSLEFTFHLHSRTPDQTFLCPDFGWPSFTVIPAGQRFFKVELFFKRPGLTEHYQNFLERLAPPTYDVFANNIKAVFRAFARHRDVSSTAEMAKMIDGLHDTYDFQPFISSAHKSTDAILNDGIVLAHATSSPLTESMRLAIENILNCPYQGRTRRNYLQRQAFQLMKLRLGAMELQYNRSVDAVYVHHASAILRQEFVNPPGVEALARSVGTNRFTLNKGFHQVYGMTPFSYLRECRLYNAYQLLLRSDLSISQISEAVGYSCRSKFAIAFRQKYGVNPKTFQMQSWAWAG